MHAAICDAKQRGEEVHAFRRPAPMAACMRRKSRTSVQTSMKLGALEL